MASQSTADEHAKVPAGIRHEGEMYPFGANAIRLNHTQWAVTAITVGVVLATISPLWQRVEPIESTGDDRVPYSLSEDYWYYNRHLVHLTSEDCVVVLGDSVIWGEYVAPNETLSHFLSEQSRNTRFVNGGLNGTHPLALGGLVQYYASSLTHRRVVVHCNLLWMSSPERDLKLDKELAFNHAQLVPQFTPWIPSYRATFADRMSVAVDRVLPFRGWVKHTRIENFEGEDLPSWTLEHPYDNPLARVLNSTRLEGERLAILQCLGSSGIEPQDFPWVELAGSLQWRAFRETVALLRHRDNEVFVVLGPLNQHLLTTESRQRFNELSREVRQWLSEQRIPHWEPDLLPSDAYADTSHPLRSGYEQLARQIHASKPFQDWLSLPSDPRTGSRSQ